MQAERSRWLTLAWDVGPVIALVALSVMIADPDRGGSLIVPILIVLPLAVRRLWPFPVLVLIATLAVASSLQTSTPWIQIAAVALAAFATGETARDRTRSALGVLSVAGLMGLAFAAQEADPVESLVLPFVVVVPAWLAGDLIRTRRIEARLRTENAARALRENEERLRTAIAEERRHMARELHDVVAHGVSVMLIQTGAARQVVESTPDRAADSLLTVEATGREVMAELRRLLGVVNDDGEASGVAPQPGLEQLATLVDRVREAGLPAELEIDGTPRTLPASLDVTAYRIVQEALTNALRYARRARTLVHLSYEPAQLRVEVLDDGPALATDPAEGSGRGLVGMRERASLVGGRLEAGPRLGGGYAVRAWLPLDGELT
jgi:signal transduction histidine kinase